MKDYSYVWNSKFNGLDVEKRVRFLLHGDFGFEVLSDSGKLVGGMSLHHTEGTMMFYILNAHLSLKGCDVPRVDFKGIEGYVDSGPGSVAELLEDHKWLLSEGLDLFERYSLNNNPLFQLSRSNSTHPYEAYLTENKDLGFVLGPKDNNVERPSDPEFCMGFSDRDSVEAIKGLAHIYQDKGEIPAGFQRVSDYFTKK